MSGEVNCRLTVLWEHELRAAAKALRRARELIEARGDEPLGAECTEALWAALESAHVALYHAAEDDRAIVISAVPVLARRRKTK